jgi:hypothetical protein
MFGSRLRFRKGVRIVKDRRDILPLVLFELSVMRETVRAFAPRGQVEADRLLSRLALLESRALGLIELRHAKKPADARTAH